MIDDPEAERRLAELEKDLAAEQTNALSIEFEERIVLARLRRVLALGTKVVERLSIGMDASIERLADDLNGGTKR